MNLVLMGQSDLEVGKDGQETQAHKDGLSMVLEVMHDFQSARYCALNHFLYLQNNVIAEYT